MEATQQVTHIIQCAFTHCYGVLSCRQPEFLYVLFSADVCSETFLGIAVAGRIMFWGYLYAPFS